jgi:hypothetical protein
MYASTIITAVLALSSATLAYPRFWKPDSASDNGDLLNKRTGMSTSVGTGYFTFGAFSAPFLTTQLVAPSSIPPTSSKPPTPTPPPPTTTAPSLALHSHQPTIGPPTVYVTSCPWSWNNDGTCVTIATIVAGHTITPPAPTPPPGPVTSVWTWCHPTTEWCWDQRDCGCSTYTTTIKPSSSSSPGKGGDDSKTGGAPFAKR